MKLTLKLNQILPKISGTGKNGTWKKQELVFETNERFPRNICMVVWGEKVNTNGLIIGNEYTVDFDIESREYKERWYTELKVIHLSSGSGNGTTEERINRIDPNDEEDILPF